MYLEERLEMLCRNNPMYKEKFSQWEVIKQDAVRMLNTVCTHFPHFSKHDHTHSRTIEVQVGKLLGTERIDKLSCSDLMLMSASIYLHDIGMALEYEEVYKKFTSKDFQAHLRKLADGPGELQSMAKRLCEFPSNSDGYEHSIDVYNDIVGIIETTYRSEHAKRSGNFIKGNDNIRDCFGIRCQKIIAEICEAHQKPVKDIVKLPLKDNGIFDDYMHPRFIAAMLCLGDLLDLDTDRFDKMTLVSAPPMPRISKLHLKKHESVERFLIDETGIYIKSNTDDISVYRLMRQWLDWIQEACDFIALQWNGLVQNDFGNAPKLVERELLFKGEKRFEKFAKLQYRIPARRMFELLEGGNIYKDKLVCIREILQNAVDATIFRLFDEGKLHGSAEEILEQASGLKWNNYKITGSIKKIDNSHVAISIRDKGIGVSEADINKIADVSNERSDNQKKLLAEMPDWIRPSGIFGVGLLSIYLLADEFVMITKTIDAPPKKITFQGNASGDGYIVVESYDEKFDQGTEVRIVADLTRMTASELRCSNYFYRRRLLSDWFLRRVMVNYSNILEANRRINAERKRRYATVPVDLRITGLGKDELVPLLKLRAFLTLKHRKIKIEYGRISTRMFFPELACCLSCNISLDPRTSDDKHIYGIIRTGIPRFSNAIFYRHEFVVGDCMERSAVENIPLLPYVDWRIDLLSGRAEDILDLNRNNVREGYAMQFLHLLLSALEKSIKYIIDYLADNACKDGVYKHIEDTILLVYQFARQYGYRDGELLEAYRDRLDSMCISNYKSHRDRERIVCSMGDLLSGRAVYFVSEEIGREILPDHVKKTVSEIKCDDKFLFRLDGGEGIHILNHRADKIFVAKVADEYLEIVEAYPFECLDHKKQAVYMDDTVLMRHIVRMMKMNIRGLPVLRGYEALATPVNSETFSVRYYMHAEEYLIELPFGDCIKDICSEMEQHGYVPKAMVKYLHRIINSKHYKENLKYIQSYHVVGNVEDLYKAFIEKILRAMGNDKYEKFNRYYWQLYVDPRESRDVYGERDSLRLNNYLSTVVSA